MKIRARQIVCATKDFIAGSGFLFGAVVIILPTAGIASHVYGTNESSYKYGYGQGKSEWVDCQNFDADCSIALDDCPIGPQLSYTNGVPHTVAVVTNITACVDGYINGWNHVCSQPTANDNGVLCPTAFWLETADTAVGTDHIYNGTTNKPTNQTVTWSIDKQALIQNSYKLGYQFGESERGHNSNFKCPIGHLAPDSEFCKGYDAALRYENGV